MKVYPGLDLNEADLCEAHYAAGEFIGKINVILERNRRMEKRDDLPCQIQERRWLFLQFLLLDETPSK